MSLIAARYGFKKLQKISIIGENWHKFNDDERVNNGLLRQIDQLKSQISYLQEKLNDTQNVVSVQD